jgi:ABC-2 type transport system ATP-binding protein
VTNKAVLQTHDLSLSYGRLRAVDRLNIRVDQGEIYGFLGRNGAGKTTTIRMLMGVIRPDAGRIELLGFRGKRIGIKQKRRIGYVSQEQHFYPWMTCRVLGDFVSGFYPTWDRAEFDRLLSVLDVPPNRRVSHLSGGMRVKLALALALAHHPPILILDEPTSGLDPVARREFLEIVRRQARKHQRTTFFSSHLVDEVERVADRVGIVHHGRLQYEGSVQSLRDCVRKVVYGHPGWDSVSAAVHSGPAAAGSSDPVVPADTAVPMIDTAADSPHAPQPTISETRRKHVLLLAQQHGFQHLRDGFDDQPSIILRGTGTQWETAPFPPSSVSPLSLEDIFIALASKVTAEL